MRKTFLVAAMLLLSLMTAGCANSRSADTRTDTPTRSTAARDDGDYSAAADGTVNETERDTAAESGQNSKKREKDNAATGRDNTVAEKGKSTVDRVADDTKRAADNVTDAADDVVDGAADAAKGAADTVSDAADKMAGADDPEQAR